MDTHEKLDLILNEIKDHYGHLPTEKNWKRICMLVTDGDGETTGNADYENDPLLAGFIEGLKSEGFIRFYHNAAVDESYYVATVKGLLFEGFVNQRDRLERERAAMNQLQVEQQTLALEQVELSRRLARMNNQMVVLTVVIAIGAVIVAWADLLEIWEYYLPHVYWRPF